MPHDPDRSQFYILLGDEDSADRATLSYQLTGEGEATFYSVYVPTTHRGQGLAGRVADEAFTHARDAGWRVRATCSYLTQAYLPRHANARELLVD
jgi:predicted GNAT family acetyltransferase